MHQKFGKIGKDGFPKQVNVNPRRSTSKSISTKKKSTSLKLDNILMNKSPVMGSLGDQNSPRSEMSDDMMNDFDVNEEAQFDELDRMEQRMEKMEQDMDHMMN